MSVINTTLSGVEKSSVGVSLTNDSSESRDETLQDRSESPVFVEPPTISRNKHLPFASNAGQGTTLKANTVVFSLLNDSILSFGFCCTEVLLPPPELPWI